MMWTDVLAFCSGLLVPLIMVLLGCILSKVQAKDINFLFGYRTTMSMKNQETWDFANKHFPKVWLFTGLVLLVISATVLAALICKNKEIFYSAVTIITLAQVAVLILAIIPTELALRKNFDKDGNKR